MQRVLQEVGKTMAGFVEMNHVYKRYQMGKVTITALSDEFLHPTGEFVVIVGPSGARGKPPSSSIPLGHGPVRRRGRSWWMGPKSTSTGPNS